MIKDWIKIEIRAALKSRSLIEQLTELEFAKSSAKGKIRYFEDKILELKQEMVKDNRIAHNWIGNGCRDILEKDWLVQIVWKELRDKRPKDEIRSEVPLFLKQYFRIRDFEQFANKSESLKTLSYPEKALIAAYKEEDIMKGDKIYDDWLYYKERSNRIGTETDRIGSFSKLKTNNKIKRIEKIISYLPLSVQQTAIDELTTLRANLAEALNTISEL